MNINDGNTRTSVRLLSICLQMGLHGGERVVPMLIGPPGIAKTKGVEAICDALAEKLKIEFPYEIYSAPQIQAEDIMGLPVPIMDEGRTAFFPLKIGQKIVKAGAGVLAFDEFGSVSPAVEAATLNVFQGGVIGEETLPHSVAIMGMMNPEDQASNGRGLGIASVNRLCMMTWTLQPAAWYDFMLGGKGLSVDVEVLPKDWEEKFGHIARSLVVSYIRRNPGQLLEAPKEHDVSKAWPSPRSWETAARLLAATMAVGERKESDLSHLAVEGCVGAGAAESFMQWVINMNLPDPEELLKDADKALKKLPKRHDQRAVTLEAVAVAACQDHKDKVKRWETAWAIVGPVFIEENDVGMSAAKHLAKNIVPGAKRPPETKKVIEILRNAGLLPS